MYCILHFYFIYMEISPFLWTIIWNIIIAFWIISVVFLIRLIKKKLIIYIDYITAVTVWLLLGIIFLWFIPELVSSWFSWEEMWIYILIWIIFFYLFELFLHWHHCKELTNVSDKNSNHNHEHKNGILMFGATMMHNAFHWVILFAAFSVNFNFWVATTIAILLHSIPQNIVNYIINHKNIKYAYFAAIWGLLWAIFTFPFADFLVNKKLYILSLISWGLLYTALADIFPEFKWKWTTMKKLSYFVFIIVGIISFLWFNSISESAHNHEHSEHHEENISMQSECEEYWWRWISDANECEWISKDNCEKLWGKNNECASVCRNDLKAEVCTMQCIEICEFGK